MSKKYRDTVEKFFKQRCGMFRGVDPKAEQLLEYTDVYTAYVEVVEQALEDFCAKHGVTAEGVFREVEAVVGDQSVAALDDEFLPAVLRVADYAYFMEQMVLTADHSDHIREGFTAAENERGVAGVWKVDKGASEFDRLDLYLAAIRVPAVFRGLAKGTFYSNKEVVLLRRMGVVSVVGSSPFGLQRLDYDLDDQIHQVANPWGAEVPVRAKESATAITVEYCQPAHLPRGSTIVHTWSVESGGRALRCSMEVRRAGASSVRFDLVYAAVTSEAQLHGKAGGKAKAAGGGAEAKGGPAEKPGAK